MKQRSLLLLLPAALLLANCGNPEPKDDPTPEPSDELTTVDLSYMDTSADPKDDFFTYCNGTWITENPVPDTESSFGSFNELEKANNTKLKSILDEVSEGEHPKGTAKQLNSDNYYTYINQEQRDAAGISAIQPIFDNIDAQTDLAGLWKQIAILHGHGIGSFFDLGVEQDLGDNTSYMTYVSQGGQSLPSKDYYFEDQHGEIRGQFNDHLNKMFGHIGYDEAGANKAAQDVMRIETALAQTSMDPIQLRNIPAQYNLMSMEDLQTMTPVLDWAAYYETRGYEGPEKIVATQPDFISNLGTVMTNEDLGAIKNYMKWHVLDATASTLTEAIDDQNFYFYATVLYGMKEKKEQWERAISNITGSPIGEALGQLFVEKYFSADSKARVNEMVDNLMAAFEDRLDGLEWMSDSTKERARAKLANFGRKLGYPDEWTDFSSLDINRESYTQNYLNTNIFAVKDNMDKLGGPIDKGEWGMPPHMVNAYYHPLYNEIAFPAGIMQPPFFDPEAEDALNYGRMGMVIGHEFSHGFDDQGSVFDANGMMANWWTEQDKVEFNSRTQKLVDQFNNFEALPGLFVKGELTLGENIADLGGLTLSYYAYQKSLEGKEREDINGFTPEQRYFISFAQLWKINYSDAGLTSQVETNPHAPGMYRVLGPLQNMPEFWAAFNVEEGDAMRLPADQVAKIW